jgi:hypothetical protein
MTKENNVTAIHIRQCLLLNKTRYSVIEINKLHNLSIDYELDCSLHIQLKNILSKRDMFAITENLVQRF